MNREIKTIGWCVLCVFALLALTDQAVASTESEQWYLVADPRLEGQWDNLEMTLHQFQRYSVDPVVEPEHAWEGKTATTPGAVQMGGTVIFDEDEEIFKMWYGGWTERYERSFVCYATSQDGIHWTKPNLGLHEYQGSTENNIVTVGNAAGVTAIYRDREETEPSKRWSMWSKQTRPGEDGIPANYAVYRFFSPDGIHWTRESSQPNLPYHYPQEVLGGVMGDAGATFWLPQLGKHVGIHQTVRRPNPRPAPSDPQRDALRIFVRFDSEDGLTWSEPTVAFDSDEEDLAIDPYHQFYNSAITPVGRSFLGLLSEYHPEQGTIDQGFAISTDTMTWVRPFHGNPVIPLGPEGAFDSKMIQSTAQLLEKDDLWWLYYSGEPWIHHEPEAGGYYSAIGLAFMPVGRIVSADAGAEAGTLTTAPIDFCGDRLQINAVATPGGSVRVELLDAAGEPIEGFPVSDPFVGNDLHHAVAFNGDPDISALDGQSVALRFHISNAELYSFELPNGVPIEPPPPPPEILFQDDFEEQLAGTGNAPIAGEDLDPGPPPIGTQWCVKYEGYPTDVPEAIQVVNGDDRLAADNDNCLYCSRPPGIGTIHVQAVFDEVHDGLVRTDVKLLNVLGAGLAYVAGHSADDTCLFTIRLDQQGNIKWYDATGGGYVDTGASYTVGQWQDLAIVADLTEDEMTVSINDGPTSEPFGFWNVTSLSKVGFLGADGSEYFVDDLTVATVTSGLIPGDANGDGMVTDIDAAILASHWQQSGMSWAKGDFNGDGVVTDADAAILAAHWQEGTEHTAVPEPTSPALLATIALSLLFWKGYRRCK